MLIDQVSEINEEKLKTQEIPDHRCISLNKASMNFLKALHCEEFLFKERIIPIEVMQIWETQGSGYLNLKDSNGSLGNILEIKNIV